MKNLVIIRGGGELGSAIACTLHRTGFRVLILEQAQPTATRRRVAFADAMTRGEATVERLTCHKAEELDEAKRLLKHGEIVMLDDADGRYISWFKPNVVVDAITADKPLDTNKQMAPFTVALGPGYCAGRDVDVVVETGRGHSLGRLVYEGFSSKGDLAAASGGETDTDASLEHIIFAPAAGKLEIMQSISLLVKQGDLLARLTDKKDQVTEVRAPFDGVLRGALPNGRKVKVGQRIAELHPTLEQEECFTISDKARCISGSVLEAVVAWSTAHQKKLRFF